ncbi:hypothetical protein [Longicatena caecimuris]|uniref:hypothetical protein n=1 Tax=Longicatena caecimuris TaxID=1796635 RepID=UPI0018AC730A|nr:hypothetical protein [Longicatena caecimuris]
MEKRYNVSEYKFEKGTVRIHDSLSREERKKQLKGECVRFVKQQLKKGTGCNLSPTKKSD